MSDRETVLRELFTPHGKPSALEGVKVLEICGINFGCMIAGSLLAELGAEVYTVPDEEAAKITTDGVYINGVGIPYFVESRGKKRVKWEDLSSLIKDIDILLDGLGPGKLSEQGMGYPELAEKYPKLIYVAISPFGHYPTAKSIEYRDVPDSDLIGQAYNGYMAMLGNPNLPEPYSYPIRAGIWLAWAFAGAAAALGALAAYWWRMKTGRGTFVDVATNDVLSVDHPYQIGAAFVLGASRRRSPTIDANLFVTYTTAKAKDRFVAIATVIWPEIEAFFEIIGRPDLAEKWRDAMAQVEKNPDILKPLEKEVFSIVKEFPAEELIRRSREKGRPPMAIIKTLEEVASQEHWRLRRAIIEVTCGERKLLMPGTPYVMSETPGRVNSPC
ncbi:L-carnitine dehydratase/bile acid-inducible protein F [Pyrobaculum islandicum DSM 4184]|uniref:L-carnitine dehydratase/bile acid-inducible protein F n=1 Tax=Pyrobaculum islandicum (strain DSM 4184 / JCM 9189 / GEO3) TaxID=384616 RepID=A1RTZ9_PYRIL|nr:CoA transferase [Pyrobaculum islandicum]ABL88431.1 L-carnitine dehydratase/bile acid-inducible protein F [Pyrobaculum islandicum DSM 4184]